VSGLRNSNEKLKEKFGSYTRKTFDRFTTKDSHNWNQWNSNEKLKEKFGRYTRKTFHRFTTKDSYTWNITHNTESAAV
jgi:hypothetical protein